MKKLLLLVIVSPLILSSCSHRQHHTMPYSRHSVDEGVKEAITESKEKVDLVNRAVSDLSFKKTSVDSKYANRLHKNAAGVKDTDYYDISKTEFTYRQNFGLYILNNVYHAVNYGYDSENIDKGVLIYDEVQNALDEPARIYLKEHSIYTKFYMQLDQSENGYHFDVDWVFDSNLSDNIYVSGDVVYEGDTLVSFAVNCLTQGDTGMAYTSYFDFANETFYYFSTSSNKNGESGLLKFMEDFNDGRVSEDTFHKYGFKYTSMATGKITDSADDLNFKGFDVRQNELSNEVKTLFHDLLEKTSALKFRSSHAELSYDDATRVHFMDAALEYGVSKTKIYYIASDRYPYEWNEKAEWHPVFIVYAGDVLNQFSKCCDQIYDGKADFFKHVRDTLIENNVSDLTNGFENEEFKFETIKEDEIYHKFNSYVVASISYRLTDKANNKVYNFEMKDNTIYIPNEHTVVDKTIVESVYVGNTEVKNPDGRSYKTDTYYNLGHCYVCDDLAIVSKTEKDFNNTNYYFYRDSYLPGIEDFYLLTSEIISPYDYLTRSFSYDMDKDASLYYSGGTGSLDGFFMLDKDIKNFNDTKVGEINSAYYPGDCLNIRYDVSYFNDSRRDFNFEMAVDVNKPIDEDVYDFYFVRNYHSAEGDFNTKQQFTYEVIAGSTTPVLTKYKIEVEVPEALKTYYQENDIEKYEKLYQECIYNYDFANNSVTTSTHNYVDKDGEPVVNTIPYTELIKIPLYFDLGYNVNDYGNFDNYGEVFYLNLINKMINGEISYQEAQINPIPL